MGDPTDEGGGGIERALDNKGAFRHIFLSENAGSIGIRVEGIYVTINTVSFCQKP